MTTALHPIVSSPRLRLEQAAVSLGVSTRTLSNWIRRGRLRVIRVGPRLTYVEVAEVERLLRGEVAGGS